MEEVLTGELCEDVAAFGERARALIGELVAYHESGARLPEAGEIAATTWRTLQLQEVAALRPGLVPEWPVYAMPGNAASPTALAGRVDAAVLEDGQASVLLDWKSDIAPTDEQVRLHAGQLQDYLRVTGAPRGALIYMTPGVVRWVIKPTA